LFIVPGSYVTVKWSR